MQCIISAVMALAAMRSRANTVRGLHSISPISALVDHIAVEPIAETTYRGESADLGREWLPTTRGRHVISVTLGGVPIEGSDFISHVS